MIRITIWNEYRHEKTNEHIGKLYPDGMHKVMAQSFDGCDDVEVKFATLDEPEHGLTDAVLDSTDVLYWWGHCAHGEVSDEVVRKVQQRVLAGMGLIVLHSGHYSKIFKTMMGSNCSLKWREKAEKERLWNVAPSHPITQGVGDYFELPDTEMYGERFDIPEPDQLIFISWFEGGEVFRSGCTWNRGNGRVFYFRPGHETFPIYYNPKVQLVLRNAAYWAAPTVTLPTNNAPQIKEPLEPIAKTEADMSYAPHMSSES